MKDTIYHPRSVFPYSAVSKLHIAIIAFKHILNLILLTILCIFFIFGSYGVKIRAPHALVMTFLFKSGRYISQSICHIQNKVIEVEVICVHAV